MFGASKKLLGFSIKTVLVLCFISGIVIAQPSQSIKQEPSKPQKAKQQPHAYQRGTNELPVIVELSPSTPLKVDTGHDPEREKEKADTDLLLARATVALAVFTLLLAGATVGLMRYTYKLWQANLQLVQDAKTTSTRQANEMQESLKIAGEAAKASQDSAVASRQMVAHMKQTNKRQLRAYAMVSVASMVHAPGPGRRGEHICISIKNFGQTPASSIHGWIAQSYMPNKPKAVPIAEEKYGGKGPFSVGVIPPSGTYSQLAEVALSDVGYEVNQGSHALFVFGEFSYKDVFGQEWTTSFRFKRFGQEWLAPGQMEMCEEGNDAT